jgi:acetyl-CoA carboxylase carboxyl transferase subunit beta
MGIFKKRSIKSLGKKKSDMPEGLWNKCPSCGAIIDEITLKQRHRVCTKCDHHFMLTSQERVEMLLDPDSFEELDPTLNSIDALGFKGYMDKVKSYQKKTGLRDAVLTGRGLIQNKPVTLGVMDFRFLGASMGSAVGEKLTRSIEVATKKSAAQLLSVPPVAHACTKEFSASCRWQKRAVHWLAITRRDFRLFLF